MIQEDFLSPRFVGERFNGHTIPLDVLKDLSVFDRMLRSVARERFLQQNRTRRRIPTNYLDGVTLSLARVEAGSAVATIVMAIATAWPNLEARRSIAIDARDAIVRAVAAAESGGDPAVHVPRRALTLFETLGRSLRSGESMQFQAPDGGATVHLTPIARLRLLEAAQIESREEEIALKGAITGVDYKHGTFDITTLDGTTIHGPLRSPFYEDVLAGLQEFPEGRKVALDGLGEYDKSNRLLRIVAVEQFAMLDHLDIQLQFAELGALRSGWFNGQGDPYSRDELAWLYDAFSAAVPDTIKLPCIYPTPDGRVRFEWELAPWDVSLEVDLRSRCGDWHALNLETDEEEAGVLMFALDDGWADVARRLRYLTGVEA